MTTARATDLRPTTTLVVAAVSLVLGAAIIAGAWLLGSTLAPSPADARDARETAYESAYDDAREAATSSAYDTAWQQAFTTGAAAGRVEGATAGRKVAAAAAARKAAAAAAAEEAAAAKAAT